jgi:mono/diheme cytochrome c family protein
MRTTSWVAATILYLAVGVARAASAGDRETLVERGEYLARAGDCLSCHTAPGGKPFAGGLPMKTPFGTLVTPNITPDFETGLGSWTGDDFYRALHLGVGKSGRDLYPVMPYTFYTKVTRPDVEAIYAYLQTVAPVRNAVDVNELYFPFDIRLSQMFWRELFFREGTYVPDPSKSDQWNRGAYLVEGLGHCGACHSPRDVFGGIEKSKELTGARVDHWFALNLTGDFRRGLGRWTIPQVVAFLRKGAAKGVSTAVGPMHEVVHNSLRYMTDADLTAMAVYLKSLPPKGADSPAMGVADAATLQGARLYVDNCGACHQSKGAGLPGAVPPLAGNPVVLASSPADLLSVVIGGVAGRGRYLAMPSFAGRLSDQDIATVANYVRTSWGNTTSSMVGAAQVATIRAAAAAPESAALGVAASAPPQPATAAAPAQPVPAGAGTVSQELARTVDAAPHSEPQPGTKVVVGPASPPPPPLPERPPLPSSGWFTAAEAKTGDTVFQNNCVMCHGGALQGGYGPALKGASFLARWRAKTVGQLLSFEHKDMPMGNAGSLTPQQYVEVTSYILQQNGFRPGSAPLASGVDRTRLIDPE